MSEPATKRPVTTRSAPTATGASKARPRAMSTGRLRGESVETRRIAALVLEVLAGVRTPSEAAEVLGISAPRYYVLEARALEGLVRACRRRPRGPHPAPEREVARLKRELERLERERDRGQALLRLAERTVGVPLRSAKSAKPTSKVKGSAGAGKKRKRRAVVRALKAAKALDVSIQKSVDGPETTGNDGSEAAS